MATLGGKVVLITGGSAGIGKAAARLFAEAGAIVVFAARGVERFGRLDCAFNNAAVLHKITRTADFSDDDFDAEVASNLKSVWLCMKYELQQMQSQEPRGGVIVNTSSINGLGGAQGGSL